MLCSLSSKSDFLSSFKKMLLLAMLFLRFVEDALCSVFRKSKKMMASNNEVKIKKKIFKVINKRILVNFNIYNPLWRECAGVEPTKAYIVNLH